MVVSRGAPAFEKQSNRWKFAFGVDFLETGQKRVFFRLYLENEMSVKKEIDKINGNMGLS